MTIVKTRNLGIALAVLFVATVALVAPLVHAADLPLSDTIIPDYVSSYSPYNDTIIPDYVSSYSPYNDYSSPSSYFGGGFGGGFSFGGGGGGWTGGSFGGSSGFAGNSTSYVANNGNSYINAPTSVNAPTTITNSGNTTITNPVVPTQVVYAQTPVYNYPIYTPVPQYYPTTTVYPIPNRQPYVSLTAVPYTGLELGPIGTIAYWSFLVMWCLIAAYLIIVKKVQNKLVSGLNSVLFGSTALTTSGTSHAAHVASTTHAKVVTHAALVAEEDAIDPFILSQIKRS